MTKPRKIKTADCETDPFAIGRTDIKPFLWGIYDPENGYIEFDNTPDFVEYIKDDKSIIYMHNGGKFDFLFLKEYINKLEPLLVINSRIVKCKIGQCELRDSYAILPVPLSAYQKTEIDYSIMEKETRDLPHNKKLISDYLKDDCIFLYNLVEGFVDEYGRGMTIASTAIKKLCKLEDIKIKDSGKQFYHTFKQFYFGGRVEAIKKGHFKGDIKLIDINSAYPYAMKHQHPINNAYIIGTDKNPHISPHNFYHIKAISHGALCRREKTGLIFDRDGEKREYFTTGHELIAGIETDTLKDIEHLTQYEFLETRDFSNYVDHFWDLRQTTKKGSPENIYAKLFLNSAYGKFCANPESYKEYMICENKHIEFFCEKLEYEQKLDFGNSSIISKPIEEEKMRFFNVATGASITGFVRAMLWRAINKTENPLYCDTDSIIYTGEQNNEISKELGQWDIEGYFTQGAIAGKKMYGLEYRDKKGVYKTATKGGRLEFNEILAMTKGETVTFTPLAPTFSLFKEPYIQKRAFKMT